MAEASVLSLKPKRKDINKYRELDDEWYSLGTELEIEDEELDDLEEKYTDPHKRLLKMFGAWLDKGENPTYVKLIKALVNIDKKDVAQSLCTDLELTSSLDSLLSTTSQAKLSECSPVPNKETGVNVDTPAPVSDQSTQKTTAGEYVQIMSPPTGHTGDQPIPLADSSQVKGHSTHVSFTTEHSKDKNEQLLAVSLPQKSVAHGAMIQIKSPVACHTSNQSMPLTDSSHQEQVKNDSAHTNEHSEVKIENSITDSSQQKSTTHDASIQVRSLSVTNNQILTHSHQELAIKDRTIDHSELKNERSFTDSSPPTSVVHDANVQAKSLSNTHNQTSSHTDSYHQEHSTKDQTVVISDHQTASIDISTVSSTTNEPHQIMLHCNDKLITALSLDPQGIAGVLLAKGLIPENIEAQMRQCSTPHEKATILVNTVRQVVKIAPDQFPVFLSILSNRAWTKGVVKVLQSCFNPEQSRKDDSTHTNEHSEAKIGSSLTDSPPQKSIAHEGHMYTAWASLDPDDKIDLEARLLTDAEIIGEKFAHLCSMTRDSFEERGITPQVLADTLKDLTVYKPGSSCHDIIPLLKEEGGALTKAQSVRDTFHALRPHMSFFNYEILKYLIERKGSGDDKIALVTFLENFTEFCKRHVFEVPFTTYSNGHQVESHKKKQKLHIKVTEHFKSAFLIKSTTEALPSTSDESQDKNVCSSRLRINLGDAKNIQRKFASILDLNPSSLFLDSISEGSVILTFLLPMCVSLAGLDHNPEIALLSYNGVLILCGPPGVPELQELTPNGIIVTWFPAEYGCNSLVQYILYYQKKREHEKKEWQKVELSSLETHACVHDLDDGDAYVIKICTLSDVGTLQCSDESDPIVWSVMRYFTEDAISRCSEMLTLMLSSNNTIINGVTTSSLTEGVISKEVGKHINLASTPNEKATILVDAVRVKMQLVPEKFEKFVKCLSDHSPMYTMNIVYTVWSEFGGNVYYQYPQYLRWLYASLQSKDQSSSDQWPPSATIKFFRLAMVQTAAVQRGRIEDKFVQMTITGKVDDILRHKYPIKLENIFKATRGRRKVILLEGAPGCGKSTLSVYICQQWEKGQLFNQFKLVILIRLRDPAIKNTKGLADLLPCSNAQTAELLARIMLKIKCQDVLFILDGWDELGTNLRKKSIFSDLVDSRLPLSSPLSKSTVIVTSRPIASGDLHQVVSSRVEILGFTAEELHQFFTECLKGDTEAVKTLLERIEENPEVAGSCYLPLNATILVHLFRSDRNTLPTTLYGIFSSLVLNCIKRHLKLRTPYKDVSIESLDQLPEFAKKPFLVLCRLAYDGVMEDKIIFTSLPVDVNTLSLLQGVESFIGREKAVSHNFLHLSIQELLAAWYIATQLPSSEQASKFNELFDKSRFSAVFRFYAAISKLRTPGIKDVVIRIARSNNISLLVSLLHCLYEAQNPSLCESVAQRLQHGLDLHDTTLTPSDCLCIGYFFAHVCKMAAGEFQVDLVRCSIGDQGCKYLVSGLHKYLDTHSAVTTLLSMHMHNNCISHHGVHHLSTLLKIGCISFLNLINNALVSIPVTISNSLKNNTTLKQLTLQMCGLNSLSAKSLAEALTTNKHLEQLNVSNNALCDDGIQHLAHALRVNQGLKLLELVSCGMTDVGLECLAKSLQHNNVLTELHLWNYNDTVYSNTLTANIIVPVLTECLKNNHTLTRLELPWDLESSIASIKKAVNDVRKRSGLPLINVKEH